MSTTTATLNVNANQAIQTLNKVQKQVDSLGSSFSKLTGILGGIAIGRTIQNLLNFSASIVDVSKATNLTTEAVIGFGRAVQQNGGTLENANNALNKFILTIDEAASGTKKTQQAFADVGVSLNDLRNLSEQDLFLKAVQGLGQISDASRRAALSNELFGKTLRGVDIVGLANDTEKAIAASKEYAASIRAADEAQQSLETAITNVKLATIQALKPVFDFINTEEGWNAITQTLKILAVTVAATFSAKVAATIFEIISAVIAYTKAIRGATIAQAGLLALQGPKGWVQIAAGIAGAAGAMYALDKIIGQTTDSAKEFNQVASDIDNVSMDSIKKYSDGIKELQKQLKAGTITQEEFQRKSEQLAESTKKTGVPEPKREVKTQERDKEIAKINNYVESLQTEFDQIAENIKLQRQAMIVGEENAQLLQNQKDVLDQATEARQKLNDMLVGLDPKTDQDAIKRINEEIAKLDERTAKTILSVTQETQALQELRKQRELVTVKGLEDLKAYQQQLANDEALQTLRDEASLIGLTGQELQKRQAILQIDKELRAKLNELKVEEKNLTNQLNDAIARGNQLEQEKLQIQLDGIKKRAEAETQAATERKQQTDKNIENEAKANESIFDRLKRRVKDSQDELQKYNLGDTIFNSLNEAIEKFVNTGKFKFKDFAASILKEWLAVKAKMAMNDVLDAILGKVKNIFNAVGSSGGSSKGGFFTNLFTNLIPKIFGFAEGGRPPVNKPSIVGEDGPELFVPDVAGRIIPNEIFDDIETLRKSIKGFANGGEPPVNKASIVGERGPELFVPKSVSNMMSNNKMDNNKTNTIAAPITNNYNTYNINALDSKSVAQVFAENRKAIFGANKLAEREMSYAGVR